MENVNFIAVLVSAVAAMVVGFLWYGKALFGKTWMKETGITDADIKAGSKEMPKTYGMMFVGALVQAYVLSLFIGYAGATTYMIAAQVAALAWIGFVAVVMLSGVLFEKKSWNLFGINAGYQLVTMIIMSAIIVSL